MDPGAEAGILREGVAEGQGLCRRPGDVEANRTRGKTASEVEKGVLRGRQTERA